MKFARIVFTVAGIYGIIVLLPDYFLEARWAAMFPPAITHPELFYGFIGVALAWQVAFLILARDPVRYRAFMIPAIIEKFTYFTAAVVLYLQRGLDKTIFAFAGVDFLLGILFLAAFLKTPRATS
jgi:hypothetical protein